MAAAALARLSKRALGGRSPLLALHRGASTAAAAAAPSPDRNRVRWDYRGQRKVIPLGQWVPYIAVDAYVAPNVVLAGQVTVYDGASVWNGSILRGDLNKISVGFCSNVQERCVLHAAWASPTALPEGTRGPNLIQEEECFYFKIFLMPNKEHLHELSDHCFCKLRMGPGQQYVP